MLTYDCIGGFEKNITIYVYMGISIHDNDNGQVKYREQYVYKLQL